MKIKSLLPFLLEADRLKTVNRQALIYNGGRLENSAEHSWHLAIAVLLFQEFAPPGTDVNKAVRMALLHDLVEIDAGDMFVYGDLSEKAAKELAALDRLAGLLPARLAEEFKSLWLEFEAGETMEARYVSAIDRFLPMYSNFLNQGYSWRNHGVSSDRVIAKNRPPIEAGLPPLWEIAQEMIKEAIHKGHLDP